ncbi:MAG: MFS transporter [Aestuariivirga sp.]
MSESKFDSGEFKRGWLVLLACVLGFGTGIAGIPFFTMGVFVGALEAEFGWARGAIYVAVTILTLVGGVASVLVGALVDRYGVRRIVILGLIGSGLGIASVGFSNSSIWSFYFFVALLTLLGCATSPVTFTRVINTWFNKSRGLALGISMMGVGIAALTVPVYAAWIIEHHGWRMAYLALGAFPILIGLPPVLLFLRDAPPREAISTVAAAAMPSAPLQLQSGYTMQEVMRQSRFWRLAAAAAFTAFGLLGIIANFIPALKEAGHSLTVAAGIFGTYGIALLIGRVGAGLLMDRFWAPSVVAVAWCGPIVTAVVLIGFASDTAWPIVAAALLGLAGGAEFDMLAYFTSRYFGMKHYGRNFGVLFLIFSLGAAVSGPAFGFWHDAYGNYVGILWIVVGLFAISIALVLSMGSYPVFPMSAGLADNMNSSSSVLKGSPIR